MSRLIGVVDHYCWVLGKLWCCAGHVFNLKEMLIRYFLTGIFLLTPLLTVFAAGAGGGDFLSTQIKILGRTNLSRFELSSTTGDGSSLSSAFHISPDRSTLSGSIAIPLESFTSRPEPIRDDFLDLTDADHNPYITIHLLQEVLLPGKELSTTLPVSITMAGKENTYQIACRVRRTDGDHVVLEGAQQVRLTDFGIDPPEKMVGLIKVENELDINFSIIFTVSEQFSENLQ